MSWALATALLAASAAGTIDARTQAAANASARGDLLEARNALAPVLKEKPDDAAALFVLACIELQAPDLAAATAAAAKLNAASPNTDLAIIVTSLVESRRQAPDAPWLVAYAAAAKKTGGRVHARFFAEPLSTERPLDAAAVAKLTGDDGFLVRVAEAKKPGERVDEALTIATGKRSFVTQLAALAVLSGPGLPKSKRFEAHAAADTLALRLAADNPTELLPALLALDLPALDAFTAKDLEAFEARLPTLHYHSLIAPLFEALRRGYARLDAAQSDERAFSHLFAIWRGGQSGLLRRSVDAGASKDLRQVNARVLAAVAAEVGEGSQLEQNIGGTLLNQAAKLDPTPERVAAAEKRERDIEATLGAMSRFDALDELPIAPLRREAFAAKAHAELELVRSLAR